MVLRFSVVFIKILMTVFPKIEKPILMVARRLSEGGLETRPNLERFAP
jgi:hypothetical protein